MTERYESKRNLPFEFLSAAVQKSIAGGKKSLATTVRIPDPEKTMAGQQPEEGGDNFVESVMTAYKRLTKGLERNKLPYTEHELRNDAQLYLESMRSSHRAHQLDKIGVAWMPKLFKMPGTAGLGMLLTQKIGFETVEIKKSQPVIDITWRKYKQVLAVK